MSRSFDPNRTRRIRQLPPLPSEVAQAEEKSYPIRDMVETMQRIEGIEEAFIDTVNRLTERIDVLINILNGGGGALGRMARTREIEEHESKQLLSLAEAARYLGVNRDGLKHILQAGHLSIFHIGKQQKVSRESIIEYLKHGGTK